MSYQHERESFVVAATSEGIPLSVAQCLLRRAQTYKRLAERECNGDDWHSGALVPCPNSDQEMRYCPHCGGVGQGQPGYVTHGRVSRSSLRMERIEKSCTQLLPDTYKLQWSGDPRGAVLRILCPSGRSNGWGDGLAVPTRY